MRTVEDFQAKYGYVTTGMIENFADLCMLTETKMGQYTIQGIAKRVGAPEEGIKALVLDGTLTKDFVEIIQTVIKDIKKEEK